MTDTRALASQAQDHRRPLARRLAAALLPLSLLSLAACSDGSSVDASGDSSAEGADSASDEESPEADASESAEAEVGVGDELESAEFSDLLAAGLEESTTARVTLEVTGGLLQLSGNGDIDYRTTPPSIAMTLSTGDAGPGEFEVRLVDRTAYLRLPAGVGGPPGKYVAIDFDDPDNPLGDVTGQLDPRSQLQGLGDALEKVVYVGEEDVDGEQLYHYALTVDTTKLDGGGPAGAAGAAGSLPTTLTWDVWFDDEQRMRRIEMDLGDEAGSFTMTVGDWGRDVDITAPAPGDVVDPAAGFDSLPG